MPHRPPSDAVVALRSLGRRFRSIFAGLGEDESPDDLARRPGARGLSAFDHVAAASRALTTRGRALDEILVSDQPTLEPTSLDTHEREAEQQPGGTVEERVSELDIDANRLADRAERVGAREWARTGKLDDGTTLSASEVLWQAVDGALGHLKDAERVLREVRGRP